MMTQKFRLCGGFDRTRERIEADKKKMENLSVITALKSMSG